MQNKLHKKFHFIILAFWANQFSIFIATDLKMKFCNESFEFSCSLPLTLFMLHGALIIQIDAAGKSDWSCETKSERDRNLVFVSFGENILKSLWTQNLSATALMVANYFPSSQLHFIDHCVWARRLTIFYWGIVTQLAHVFFLQ